MSISKEHKHKVIQEHSLKDSDTGSVEVQCAILTVRIKSLTDHFNGNKKDFQSRRGLLVLVNRRRRLLKYLASKNEERYSALIKKLGLRR